MVQPTVCYWYTTQYYCAFAVFFAEKTPVNLPYKSFHKHHKTHEKTKQVLHHFERGKK